MHYKETGQTRFRGVMGYSRYWKTWYYTTDGITFTDVRDAMDVKEVKDE